VDYVKGLLFELDKSVEILGVGKVISILKTSRVNAQSESTNDPIIDHIIDEVCKKFSIDKTRLKVNRANNIKVAMAVKFICYYCYDTFNGKDFTYERICNKIFKHRNTIYTYYQNLVEIKKNDSDEAYMRYFKEFDIIFKDIKKVKNGSRKQNRKQGI
jgi:hypothetical protein